MMASIGKRLSAGAFLLLLLMCVGICTNASQPSLDDQKLSYIQQLETTKGQEYANYYKQNLLDYAELSEPVDIVFLGDSLTARGSWETLSKSLRIVNMGINNDIISGLEIRLDQVAALNPRALFLLIGINDLSARWRPEVYKDYDKLLDDLVIALPNTKIFVQSILPVRDDVRSIMSNTVLVTVNERIQGMVLSHELTYIDVFHSLLNPKENEMYREYQIDGLHLSKAGYEMWYEVITPYIHSLE